MWMKNTLLVAGGIGIGLVAANYMTDGAVFEAASSMFSNVKNGIVNKVQGTVDAVADTADLAVDMAETV